MKNKTKQRDVFLVDEDSAVQSAVADDLKKLGCKVSYFVRAVDCLELLTKKNCNLLIADENLLGMDGLTSLSRIRHVAPWVSIVVIVSFRDIPTCVRALKL